MGREPKSGGRVGLALVVDPRVAHVAVLAGAVGLERPGRVNSAHAWRGTRLGFWANGIVGWEEVWGCWRRCVGQLEAFWAFKKSQGGEILLCRGVKKKKRKKKGFSSLAFARHRLAPLASVASVSSARLRSPLLCPQLTNLTSTHTRT